MKLKRFQKFYGTGYRTIKEIAEAFSETSKREGLSKRELLLSFLKQSYSGAYYMITKEFTKDIDLTNSIENIKNKSSKKLVVLLGGYNLTNKSLSGLTQDLIDQGIEIHEIKTRFRNINDYREIIKQVDILLKNKENKEKNISFFGYSSGGILAHKFGENYNKKSISYGMSSTTDKTMISTLLELFGGVAKRDNLVPRNGKNIIEGFSSMVPHTGDLGENTERINGIHTHMSLNQERVIKHISRSICDTFE